MNVRNNKSTIGERVDNISGLFVNFDLEDGPRLSGKLNSVRISREFSDPPEFNLKFMYNCRNVIPSVHRM